MPANNALTVRKCRQVHFLCHNKDHSGTAENYSGENLTQIKNEISLARAAFAYAAP
jgi:hypothetical protein